ncbi:transcription initiation factor IIB [Kappamyces sp. JEL0680]|nr:transcription initiation factor IIB [Kappamyces sp. JEL0680]
MVKGNGDRRRQLAAQRKADQVEERIRKGAGPERATHSEVRARLLDYCRKGRLAEDRLLCHVIAMADDQAEEGPRMCPAHLRAGVCPAKRCRFKHECSLAHLQGMEDGVPETESNGVTLMKQIPLRLLNANDRLVYDKRIRTKVRLPSPLLFISYEGRLIFDYANPKVFAEYIAAEHAKQDQAECARQDQADLATSPVPVGREIARAEPPSSPPEPIGDAAAISGASVPEEPQPSKPQPRFSVIWETICGNCGLVLGNRIIDTRSEWRTFANSDEGGADKSRVGGSGDPNLGSINQLEETVISGLDKRTGLSFALNKAQSKVTHDKSTMNLIEAFKSIDSMASSIQLPRIIVDTAKQLYKRVEDEKLIKAKNMEAVKAACLIIACSQHQGNRTFKEICNLTKVSKKEVGKVYKQLQPLFKDQQISNLSLDAHVFRFSSQMDIDSKVQQAAVKIVKRVTEDGCLAGRSPITVVAACLYFACLLSDDPKSAKEIADVAQCSDSTLRNAYRTLFEKRLEFGKDLKLKREPAELGN